MVIRDMTSHFGRSTLQKKLLTKAADASTVSKSQFPIVARTKNAVSSPGNDGMSLTYSASPEHWDLPSIFPIASFTWLRKLF